MGSIDVAFIRGIYPEFDVLTDQQVQQAITFAVTFFEQATNELVYSEDILKSLTGMIAAHFLVGDSSPAQPGQQVITQAGVTQMPGTLTSASVDNVSVSFSTPSWSDRSAMASFFSKSKYGINLLAMLSMLAAGGVYVARPFKGRWI